VYRSVSSKCDQQCIKISMWGWVNLHN